MAYYYKDGSGIDSSAYIYVQLQVTRTDYPTYSHFSVKSVAVSDTGSSSFIRGQVTTNQAGNSWTAATGWKSVSYNGTTTLATATFDVARGASNKTAHIGAYAEGGGTGIYSGGTDYAWLDVTVPKVLAPNAPTGCTATYVSDSQASVSWTNGTADSDHPRDATLVERRDGSNEWAQVASVSGTASSYTDNGISPNGQYQYRVRAKNVAGYSAYSTGGSIYTTPASPASVTLDKTAATTVQVNATGTWVYAVTYDVELTYDGGSTWSTVATSTSLPYSATVSGGTVQFRVRATRGALASAWTLSASLVTITPPLAPTIVQAPANPTAYGDGSTVAWTPNHPDGSTQSAAEVKVTNPGGTSTTYSVSTATSYSFTPNATGTWTAQVRTKGLDPSYGEWSQTVSWGVYNPPSVVITSPATDGTDVVSLPMTVSWSVTDSTGVSAQRIIIEGDGGEILNRTLAGDVRTVALNASDVALENGQTYTIRLRVRGGSGLVTEQTRIFDVAWLAPAAPVLQFTEGEGRSAIIDVMDTHYSESGAIISVDGSAIADSFTVFGKSTQDGTPTPSAPVAIESIEPQNLLDDSNVYNLAVSGSNIASNASYRAVWCEIPPASSTRAFSFVRNTVEGNRFRVYGTMEEPASGVTANALHSSDDSALSGWFPVPQAYRYIFIYLSNAGGTISAGNIAIYDGADAPSTVIPYGSLGVSIKDADNVTTTYPIDLQGNSLCSLPDGTRDELRVGERKVLVKRCGETMQAVTDGVTGTVGVDVLSSTGQIANGAQVVYKLATPHEIDLGAVSDHPFIPEDGEMWVDGTEMEAVLRPADYAGQPTIQSVDVQRVNSDGTAWTVATGLTVGGSCIDPLPPLGVPVTYRATSSAASGSTASGEFTETFGGRDWVLNFGNAAQEHVEFIYNPQADLSLAQGGKGYHFADGGAGKGLPVFYPTTDRDYAGTLKFDTILYGDTDKVLDLCDRYPVAWLRDPFGHRWRAQVSPSVSHGVGQVWPVTLSWDAMRFEEAWDG